ncbi:hypothetical protein [Streptomyces sp. NPDC046925]|uniref:hypothetical protein n=1 Tax=Streptomyces sp. NPDC046925 TaxID=3155375 RepID=UPI0033F3CDB3
MSSTSGRSSTRWLLEATCQSAHCENPAWGEQLQLLRSVGTFDHTRQVWLVRIGTLDADALRTLQILYTAAARFGTHVKLATALAPDHWHGTVFDDDGELAHRAAADADQGRPLGQLLAT